MVGLKLANGDFYPIMEDDEHVTKKLVLTTVRDDQENVKIDLYRSSPDSPTTSREYIASLVLENIEIGPAGNPDIELSLSLDATHNLSVLVKDAKNGEYQSLRINIENIDYGDFDMPDLDIDLGQKDEGLRPEQMESEEDFPALSAAPAIPSVPDRPVPAGRVRPNLIALGAFLLFGLLILAVLIYLFFFFFQGTAAPHLEALLHQHQTGTCRMSGFGV